VPPRILLFLTDLEIGGTPTVVRELATRLARSGVYVHVACLDKWGPVADQLIQRQIEVTALNAACREDVTAVIRLIQLIHAQRINTVFSFLVHANAAAAACRPFFPGVRFIQSIQTTQPTPKWHWAVQRIAQVMASKIVVPSASVAKAAEKLAGVPASKIVVIPNGIAPADFQRPPGRSGATIGFIGRLDPIKRVTTLIWAMPMLDPGISLQIFGEGEDRPAIEAEIARLNLQSRVTLHGFVTAVAAALATLDVLVLPSAAEGFPLVLIEAMAAGVPIVATDVPGIRDVIIDGVNGILAPANNLPGLAAAIRQALTDQELRSKLIEGGREAVAGRFNWETVFKQYESLLIQS
jgi:glycosyltransferase involved in cell wall biosynthesis